MQHGARRGRLAAVARRRDGALAGGRAAFSTFTCGRSRCVRARTFIFCVHIYDTPFKAIPPPCRVSLGYPAAGNSKFVISVNPATESCDTGSCNSVAGFSVTGFPRWKILEDSQDGRSTSPKKSRRIFFFFKRGGVKLPKLTLVLWWSTVVTKMVDHIFENLTTISDFGYGFLRFFEVG